MSTYGGTASLEVRQQTYNPNTKIMPTFKLPKNLNVSIEPYAALVVAEYLRQASEKEQAPSLSGMLDYAAMTIFDALRRTVPPIRGEHLMEQSEAHIQELLRGVDWLWEDQKEAEAKADASENKEERPPSEDEWDPEHGEDWKKGTPS
jgi:hypothetical protein